MQRHEGGRAYNAQACAGDVCQLVTNHRHVQVGSDIQRKHSERGREQARTKGRGRSKKRGRPGESKRGMEVGE
eukprot:3476142-Pleurochrysis_carterae.AAC.1